MGPRPPIKAFEGKLREDDNQLSVRRIGGAQAHPTRAFPCPTPSCRRKPASSQCKSLWIPGRAPRPSPGLTAVRARNDEPSSLFHQQPREFFRRLHRLFFFLG